MELKYKVIGAAAVVAVFFITLFAMYANLQGKFIEIQSRSMHIEDILEKSENGKNELEEKLNSLKTSLNNDRVENDVTAPDYGNVMKEMRKELNMLKENVTNNQENDVTPPNYENEMKEMRKELNMLKENVTNNQENDVTSPNYENEMKEMRKELNMLKETQNNLKEAVLVGGAHDCKHLYQLGFSDDGIYNIRTFDGKSFKTWCDMTNGGWIIMQRRYDGSTNFNQNLDKYADGFGDLRGEYWLGLENVHQLTKDGTWELMVEMETYQENRIFALYSDLKIGQSPGYSLHVGGYNASSTAEDSLVKNNNGLRFRTMENSKGSWWYRSAPKPVSSNLNAFVYGSSDKEFNKRMFWTNSKTITSFSEYYTQIKKSCMKIRPQ